MWGGPPAPWIIACTMLTIDLLDPILFLFFVHKWLFIFFLSFFFFSPFFSFFPFLSFFPFFLSFLNGGNRNKKKKKKSGETASPLCPLLNPQMNSHIIRWNFKGETFIYISEKTQITVFCIVLYCIVLFCFVLFCFCLFCFVCFVLFLFLFRFCFSVVLLVSSFWINSLKWQIWKTDVFQLCFSRRSMTSKCIFSLGLRIMLKQYERIIPLD